MNQKQLFKKLSILFDLGEHKIKSNLVLKNINSMDSLKQMELISLLEQNVKRQLTPKEIKKLKKVEDIIKLLNIK